MRGTTPIPMCAVCGLCSFVGRKCAALFRKQLRNQPRNENMERRNRQNRYDLKIPEISKEMCCAMLRITSSHPAWFSTRDCKVSSHSVEPSRLPSSQIRTSNATLLEARSSTAQGRKGIPGPWDTMGHHGTPYGTVKNHRTSSCVKTHVAHVKNLFKGLPEKISLPMDHLQTSDRQTAKNSWKHRHHHPSPSITQIIPDSIATGHDHRDHHVLCRLNAQHRSSDPFQPPAAKSATSESLFCWYDLSSQFLLLDIEKYLWHPLAF